MSSYQIDKIRDGLWAITEGMVHMYLLEGWPRSVLIDTGCGTGDLKETVFALTQEAVTVINTHSHGDHTGGNQFFNDFYMHPADRPEILKSCRPNAGITDIKDGDVISTGKIALEVIAIPGHTPGSIALLDKEKRILFSSDMFAKGFPIYMQYPGQDINQYHQSIRRIIGRIDEFDVICPCHGELQIKKEDLLNVEKCCEGILKGSIQGEEITLYDGSHTCIFRYKDISIFH